MVFRSFHCCCCCCCCQFTPDVIRALYFKWCYSYGLHCLFALFSTQKDKHVYRHIFHTLTTVHCLNDDCTITIIAIVLRPLLYNQLNCYLNHSIRLMQNIFFYFTIYLYFKRYIVCSSMRSWRMFDVINMLMIPQFWAWCS